MRATLNKGLPEFIEEQNAEVYCLQEIKIGDEDLKKLIPDLPFKGYQLFWSSAEQKGRHGVMMLVKEKPADVIVGIGDKKFDNEGRTITIENDDFYVVNTYFPNAGRELDRLNFKLDFNNKYEKFITKLSKEKPVIMTGDFNVAHKEIDLANPRQNEMNAGFTKEERAWFDQFLNKGNIDTFREFEKEPDHYTWWTYRFGARENNIGWRIDYFVTTPDLKKEIKESSILKDVYGSDHAPIQLMIDI